VGGGSARFSTLTLDVHMVYLSRRELATRPRCASLTTQRLDSAFSCLGVMSSLDVVSEESRFWTACTTRPG
jgi:hypothetical protein